MRRESNSKDYVTDGLILHLDAIKNAINGTHSNSTTTWYDLSPSANNVTLVNPSWSDAYLTFTGSTRGETGANLNLAGRNQCTIEVFMKSQTAAAAIILEQTTNYNNTTGAFVFAGNAGPFSYNIYAGFKKSTSYIDGGFNAMINEDVVVMQYDDTTNVYATELEWYLNAVNKTLVSNNSSTTDTNLISAILYIGMRSPNIAPFYGVIRAIRIYNRKLSTAELYQNKITDFRRYGIIK